jgi:glycine cleavage system H lipoate-binding protein
MEGSSYIDIFATKGVEYLMVLMFLLLLVLFWKLLRPAPAPALGTAAERPQPARSEWFDLAAGRYYHQGHSWALPEDSDVVRVGIDDFAQKLLGKLDDIVLPRVGSQVQQGDKGWACKVQSKSIDMLSPIHGEVMEVNEAVLQSPELVGEDPYKRGWLFKVRASRLQPDLKNLLSGQLASTWMQDTVRRLRHKLAGHELGTVMQDGGVPVSGFAMQLSTEEWDEVAADFLMSR